MGAEQKISASAFTHRGEDFDSNTGNFLLDGRQPFGFELDNSNVSVIDQNRNFFFAVCDTKLTDDLNASVSGIKELKKLHSQLKTGARDIKSNTEILGECFVGTEDLLYDTAGYAERERSRPGKTPVSSDKTPVSYTGKDVEDEEEQGEALDDVDEESFAGKQGGQRSRDEDEDEFDDLDDRDYDDEDEDYDDVELPAEEPDVEPGKKGFSTAGFILSEKKGSILAQGECEAFMFRGGSLRVLSGGNKKVSVTLNRTPAVTSQSQQYKGRAGQSKPYGGRSSEIFEPREGDVYMLCTTTVVNAIGEENIDSYLSIKEDIATINSSIMYDAVKNDPLSNMTCMLVRVDEILDDEAAAPAGAPQMRRGADYGRQDMYDAGAAAGAGIQGGGYGQGMPGDGRGAMQPRPGPGGRPAQGAQLPYMEQETRVSQTPYQNRDAFSKRATSRFDTPPRKISLAGNKSLITSIITSAALILILFLSYYFLMRNNDENQNGNVSNRPTTTSTANAATTTTRNGGNDDDENGDNGSRTTTSVRTTTTTEPTTTTTTEEPEQLYEVKSGDTLTRIAQRFYGNANGRLYPLIKERNGLTSDDIKIGDKLYIPPMPQTTTASSGQGSDAPATQQGAGTTAGRQSATTTRR